MRSVSKLTRKEAGMNDKQQVTESLLEGNRTELLAQGLRVNDREPTERQPAYPSAVT